MSWFIARREISGFMCAVLGWNEWTTGTSGTMGCQATIAGGIGQFGVRGVEAIPIGKAPDTKYVSFLRGDPIPANTAQVAYNGYGSKAHHATLAAGVGTGLGPLTDEIIKDMLYTQLVPSLQGYGAIVFSDRVNRGTRASMAAYRPFGTTNLSTAAFAAWLGKHPEYGPVFSSPVFHNPNHTSGTDFSLCQIWTFFPKSREGRFFVDEASNIGTGPDTNLFTKDKLFEKYRNEAGYDPETYLKVTHDQFDPTKVVV